MLGGPLISIGQALALLSTTLATVSAATSPKVLSFDFEKRNYADNSMSGYLRRRQESGHLSVPITNVQDVFYYMNISIGTPAQSLEVQLDTGSSDLWVLSKKSNLCATNTAVNCPYGAFDSSASKSFVDVLPGAFNITYLLGDSNAGDLVNDTIHVGGITLSPVTFGLVTSAAQGDNNGIVGVGYSSGESTIQSAGGTYANFVDNLILQGHIESRSYSLFLDDLNSTTGTILFGGVDTEKYSGNLISVPIKADVYTGIIDSFDLPLTSVSFRSNSSVSASVLTLPDTIIPVTLDSGSTDILLPNDLAAELYRGMGAIAADAEYGDAFIPCSYGESAATIEFGFAGEGGPTIAVPISEFALPLVDNEGRPARDPNTNVPVCRFGVSFGGQGPYLLGDVFLRSAYAVYDITNNQIALAQAKYGSSSSNIVNIGSSIPGVSSTATGSPFTAQETNYVAIQTAAAIRTAQASDFVASVQATPTFQLGLSPSQTAAVTTGVKSSSTTSASTSHSSNAAIAGNVPSGQNVVVGLAGAMIAAMLV